MSSIFGTLIDVFLPQSKVAKLDLKLSSAYLTKVGGRRHGIPGLASITRKDSLALSTQRMERTRFGPDFQYLPKTYIFPSQASAFSKDTANVPTKPHPQSQHFITKPANDSCGNGIIIHSNAADASSAATQLLSLTEKNSEKGHAMTSVLSHYIPNPFTLHGHKFDFRLYAVLVPTTSSDLSAFLYNDGLLRFATLPYGTEGGGLTNYSLNGDNVEFNEDNEDGKDGIPISNIDKLRTHKWSLLSAIPFFPKGFDFYRQAGDILSKVAASASIQGGNSKTQKGKYELIGLDLMFDETGKMWLLEVQNRPNLLSWSGLDRRIKEGLVDDVRDLLETLQAGGGKGMNRGGGGDGKGKWEEVEYKHCEEARKEAQQDGEQRAFFDEILKEDEAMHYRHRLERLARGIEV